MSERRLHITMPDGSIWSVPVTPIIEDRVRYYKSIGQSIDAPSEPEIIDWAEGNMDWKDVAAQARCEKVSPPTTQFQEGWLNGKKEIKSHE